MHRFMIIDGNAIIHRAYHALPPLTNKEGLMLNAVYGFTSMLFKVWNDLKPSYIAVTFDMAGPTFRHVKYDKYKATRVKADQELYDQIPLAHEVVRALNIPIYEKQGYEADDVIGTLVKQIINLLAGKAGHKSKIINHEIEIFIVTGDMDTLQLIGNKIKVYTLRKGMSDVVVYDKETVEERFGFEPVLMVDYKALRGDASDNIPGVPGIGEKTATELIQKFGSIENIYDKIKNHKSKIINQLKPNVAEKLRTGEESAKLSKQLATIDQNVPDLNFNLENCRLKEFDKDSLLTLFQRLEFISLLKRLPGFEDVKFQTPKSKKREEFKFVELKNKNESRNLSKLIKEKGAYGCRAIIVNGDVLTGELKGFVIAVELEGYYLPQTLNPIAELKNIFEDEKIELIGHNLKELMKVTTIKNRLFDAMLASYLLNPGSRAHDARSVILKTLGKELPAGVGQKSLFGVDAKAAAVELCLISQTRDKLAEDLQKADNLGLFEKMEIALIQTLAEMELNGVAVDRDKLKELSVQITEEIKQTAKKIYKLAGEEFNVSSPLQLREILFEKLNIPIEGVKKGKTGLSTSAEELERLRGLHPIIDEISEYRELAKLQNTYIDVLPGLINKKTGRVHTHFNQAVTATGRLSSSDPNLQNIPVRTVMGREIRKAFIAEEGNILVSADYSQIELRIVASLAKDKRLMEIFEQNEDVHRATAAAIHNVQLSDVTPEMRRAAKEVNFGVLYGMGAYGLAWRAGISREDARIFIDKYFTEFSGVKKYIDETLEFTKKEGFSETLFGRRRYIPELNSGNYQLRSAAERMAINHPIQGTAADLIKMAMIQVSSRIKRGLSELDANETPRGDKPVKMILQVHDELVFEVKKGMEEKAGKLIKEIMENVATLNVPIVAEVHSGRSWGEIK